jgi:hypothetical protein
MENPVSDSSASASQQKVPTLQDVQTRLMSMPIQNENDALNAIVSFLNLAQRRGCFSIDESAKIWECIKLFQR